MRRLLRAPSLAFLCAMPAAPGWAQDRTSRPDSMVTEIQKLNPVITFIRKGGDHFAVFMESEAFLSALVRLGYPLAKRP